MTRLYQYLGPPEIRQASLSSPDRLRIDAPEDVQRWIAGTVRHPSPDSTVTVTFIVDLKGAIWIADQHSEHVACADGDDVLAAGEMTFQWFGKRIEVIAVTNQSTGYCPEPESWPAVAAALNRSGLAHPGDFTTAYQFRQCDACGTKNLIKDDWFVCGVCDAPLSRNWNFQ